MWKGIRPRLIVGWPTAEIAVMGGAQAAKVLLQIEMASLKSKGEEISKEKEESYLTALKRNMMIKLLLIMLLQDYG